MFFRIVRETVTDIAVTVMIIVRLVRIRNHRAIVSDIRNSISVRIRRSRLLGRDVATGWGDGDRSHGFSSVKTRAST